MNNLHIQFNPPTFPDNTIPKGFLPRDMGAQACWWYYILCEKQKMLAGDGPEDQIIVEDIHDPLPWRDKHYVQTARTIAMVYGVGVEEMFNYWPAVKDEAFRLGLPEPHPEYINPRRFMI